MSSDNPTAERLLSEARKKTAATQSPLLAQIGIGLGALGFGLGASVIPIAGWILGAIAAGLGAVSIQRGIGGQLAKIALLVGVLAILAATFNFTWFVANGNWWYESL